MSSESLHIPRDRLSQAARLLHHAITSLKEELDAVDWYRQRADDTEDEALKQVLLHNMREEMEHACMLIEWLRRNDADFAERADTYLYSTGMLTEVEAAAEAADPASTMPKPAVPAGGFTIGSLKRG